MGWELYLIHEVADEYFSIFLVIPKVLDLMVKYKIIVILEFLLHFLGRNFYWNLKSF